MEKIRDNDIKKEINNKINQLNEYLSYHRYHTDQIINEKNDEAEGSGLNCRNIIINDNPLIGNKKIKKIIDSIYQLYDYLSYHNHCIELLVDNNIKIECQDTAKMECQDTAKMGCYGTKTYIPKNIKGYTPDNCCFIGKSRMISIKKNGDDIYGYNNITQKTINEEIEKILLEKEKLEGEIKTLDSHINDQINEMLKNKTNQNNIKNKQEIDDLKKKNQTILLELSKLNNRILELEKSKKEIEVEKLEHKHDQITMEELRLKNLTGMMVQKQKQDELKNVSLQQSNLNKKLIMLDNLSKETNEEKRAEKENLDKNVEDLIIERNNTEKEVSKTNEGKNKEKETDKTGEGKTGEGKAEKDKETK